MLRATSFLRARHVTRTPFDLVTLSHDQRRLRRKLLTLVHGDEVMVDLPEPTTFESGDVLVLEDGRLAEIIAAEEWLYEIRGRDPEHLMEIAWHLGNRHLPAEIEWKTGPGGPRILIARDHVMRDMLVGLGATVTETAEPFSPLRGAYHSHDHALLQP